jgi:hypothetical protein
MSKGVKELSDGIESNVVSLCKNVDLGVADAMIPGQSEDLLLYQDHRLRLAVQLHIVRQHGLLPPSPYRSTPLPYHPPCIA